MNRRAHSRDRREEEHSGTKKRKTKKQREKEILVHTVLLGVGILAGVLLILLFFKFINNSPAQVSSKVENVRYDIGDPTKQVSMPELDVQLLTVNEFSRPGTPTDKITGVVVHYTANPGSTAQNNRDYFENLKDTQDNKVSSNFVIGLDGEIIQCIPTSEVAYASNSRNNDTVSIECCHPDESGEFTDATYQSLVELVAFLCGKFGLSMDDVIRHYDVTGKDCPKYFVENENQWQEFKSDVAKYIEENGE